jgi:hypothetical protein
MIWITTLLFILTVVFAYTTFNLLRKNELYESSIDEFEISLDEQETLISNIATKIDESMMRMKEIDKIGSFEADDETGVIFKNIYDIISELENYYGEKEESEK